MTQDGSILIALKAIRGVSFSGSGPNGDADALRECGLAGFEPLYAPELAVARANAEKGSKIWEPSWLTPSIRATGRTKGGTPVVVYAHEKTYFSNSENVRAAGTNKIKFAAGAAPMPQEAFDSLLAHEGNGRVFIVDHAELKQATSGIFPVFYALKHPQTIPFLGGQAIAEAYIHKYLEVCGDNILISKHDDLKDEPMARMLRFDVGEDCRGLYGNGFFGGRGHILGVASKTGSDMSNLESKVETLSGEKKNQIQR